MKTKEWTLMFYFASDNPLASTIVSQLKAIKDAGYHPDANVIAHFDPHESNAPVHVFDVNHVSKFWYPGRSEVGFASNNPFIRDLVLDRLWGDTNPEIRNMVVAHVKGDPEWMPGAPFDPPKPTAEMTKEQDPKDALENFLKFCRDSYPARHYMLFILGHGQVVGNDNLLYDDHATKKSLTLTELGTVLRAFNSDVKNNREPGQVELVTLHSCSMSAMEVAYELKGAANYMLASQGPSYVGNLPYKQILIRIFNDLNSRIVPEDINGTHEGVDGKEVFISRLFRATEPVSKFIRQKLTESTDEALKTYRPGTKPAAELLSRVLTDVNKLLEREDTDDELKQLIPRNGSGNGASPPKGYRLIGAVNRRRVNRALLAEAFPEIARYPRPNVETMLRKIFFYCFYNSYDFQLAGYPYDLCLTDLTKVSDTEEPINRFAETLIKGLHSPIPKQLILLSHWDAQSFYQEDYVDLYDFCFCLRNRCLEMGEENFGNTRQSDFVKACTDMIEVLEKGTGITALAAFSGAAFQYSHGHSIYFPWSQPDDQMWQKQYGEYRLNIKTKWREFLNVYFEKTMRRRREEELGPKGKPTAPQGLTSNILALVGQIGAHVFADGSLEKPGPDHPMGKYGPDDPFGGGCDCPGIKNYPKYISKVTADDGKEVQFHASENFFEGMMMLADSNGS